MSKIFEFNNRYIGFVLVAVVTVLAFIGIVGTNDNDNGGIKKPFTLAFVDQNWKLRIRWSDDGLNWTAATGGNPSIDRAPGIAANDAGVLYLALFQDSVSDAKYMMGVGPGTWDSTPSTVGNGHRGKLDSGTSIVHVSEQNWLVAFQNGNQARVFEFNSSPTVRDFGNDVTPVTGVTNNNLADRPAIVNRNGFLLASWLMDNKQLQMVTGNIVSGAPVWNSGYIFDTPEAGFLAPEHAHDLATDGQKLYLAIVRERVPEAGQILKRFFMFIYTSTDGLHWTKLTSREVKISTALSIACRATNDIVAILTASAYNKAMRFDGSSWTFLNENAVFGSPLNNAGHDLTLFARH